MIRDAEHLVDQVVQCVPRDFTAIKVSAAVTSLLNRAVISGLVYGADWSTIWPESDAEWEGVEMEFRLQIRDRVDMLTLSELPELLPERDDDRARFKMIEAELGALAETADLEQLHTLIDQVSPTDQLLPHQAKWQMSTLAVRAYELGYKQATRDKF